jgi:hypothetical protein
MIPNPFVSKKPAPPAQGGSLDEQARKRLMAIMPGTAPAKPAKPTTALPGAPSKIGMPTRPKTATGGFERPKAPVPGKVFTPGVQVPAVAAATAAPPPSATSDSIDQMIRDRVARELAGETPDTSAQEALIRQQQDAAIGSGAVNARARAGRGGFESSGALMGMEGDIERQARAAATEQTLGVRDRARQEQFDRQQSVIDSELALRDSASNDMINSRMLELLGMTDGVDVGSSPGGDDNGDGVVSDDETSARVQERLISEGYDADGDGTISNSERQASGDQKMAAHEKFASLTPEQRKALPTVAIGGDWVALSSVDRTGSGKGLAYNKKTGAIAHYNL